MNTRMSTSETTATPSGPRRRLGARVLLLVAAIVTLATAASVVMMTSDGKPDVTPSTGNPDVPSSVSANPATTLDVRLAAKAAVIDAYTRSYQEFVAVASERSPSPDDPRLSRYSTGSALIAKQRALTDNKSKNLVLVGAVEVHATVIDIGTETATIVDCNLDRTALVDARTGTTVVDAGPPGGLAITAKLRLEGGGWKVSDFTNEKRSCVPPAA